MCGIFASTETVSSVAEVLSAMSYRGPDTLWVVGAAGFQIGFARLAIVDTDAEEARQPHRTAKGRIVAFNGEIYNYRDLDPTAKSEVELLGRMLDEGLDVRQYLDGDYAILYYDPSNRFLTLYRDRFGACPLYYQMHPFLAVSSERRRLQNPIEVPAHGYVGISGTSVSTNRIKHYGAVAGRNALLPNKTFRQLFLPAVALRAAHSDSSFSLALSGGLDSSCLLFALWELKLPPVALVVVSMESATQDYAHAQLAADWIGWGSRVIHVQVSKEQLHQDAPLILEHLDQPGCAPGPVKWRGAVRNWYAAKYSPTRVLLSGEGADELLGGYPVHYQRGKAPYQVAAKCLSTIQSMPSINLDRTNKLGMAWSREYRMPFLASTLSYYLLSSHRSPGKLLLRRYLTEQGAPPEIINRDKYSADESMLESTQP